MPVLNSADDFGGVSPQGMVTPATRLVPHSASATAFKPCRGFIAKGTETITVDGFGGGTAVDIPVVQGNVYAIRIVKCSTSASGIVLLY